MGYYDCSYLHTADMRPSKRRATRARARTLEAPHRKFLHALMAGLLFALAFIQMKAHAAPDLITDVPGQIALASLPAMAPEKPEAALFGSEEARSGDLTPFTKWTGMFARFQEALSTPEGKAVIAQLQKDLEQDRNLPLEDMTAKVNDLMNRKPYIQDADNWGHSDYWATPVEFLQRGGDCEDYAIAKYTALRALGVPEARLRLAIVHDTFKNVPHAVLVVYADKGPLILDNQVKAVTSGAELKRYRPIFSINQQAWWLHTAPDTTLVASAR